MKLMWGAAHAAEDMEIDEGAGSLVVKASGEMLSSGRGFRAELSSVGQFATPGRREASPPVAPYSEPGIASP